MQNCIWRSGLWINLYGSWWMFYTGHRRVVPTPCLKACLYRHSMSIPALLFKPVQAGIGLCPIPQERLCTLLLSCLRNSVRIAPMLTSAQRKELR